MFNLENIEDSALKKRFLRLTEIIESYNSTLVAFSGGVDSTLLAYISGKILSNKSIAVTIVSDFISQYELNQAKSLATNLEINHKVINADVLSIQDIVKNDKLRCKYCKEAILSILFALAKKEGLENVLDGSNLNDLGDYRPGFVASKSLGTKSPYIDAEISKQDIRILSKALKIPNFNKPASACLASRVPYGTEITLHVLHQIEKAETILRDLKYKNFRVRHHDKIARIELIPEDIELFIFKHRKEVDNKFKELGYSFVCIDLAGYSMGSMNKLVNVV